MPDPESVSILLCVHPSRTDVFVSGVPFGAIETGSYVPATDKLGQLVLSVTPAGMKMMTLGSLASELEKAGAAIRVECDAGLREAARSINERFPPE
jgi:hypothetical protein